MRAKSGSSNGACELISRSKRSLGSGTCLVEDTAVIWRDIMGVKEDAFLYWTVSVIGGMLRNGTRCFTSLEAGDWSGYLYPSSKKVREGREGEEEYES